MFESFIHLGPSSINGTNVYRSFLKFSIVAGGGTLVGLTLGYLSSFMFKSKSPGLTRFKSSFSNKVIFGYRAPVTDHNLLRIVPDC